MPLLEARKQYKPFEYPWAFDMWKRQQQIHWMPEEVPLGEDCRDWAQKLSDHERNLLTQIFRFFTQADVEVQDCYHEKYGRVFKPTEIKMMLAVALRKRGDAANVGATAMLIGGMMVMTFGLLMSAFWVAFATGGPANLTAENVQ